jgi:hypothetical protein
MRSFLDRESLSTMWSRSTRHHPRRYCSRRGAQRGEDTRRMAGAFAGPCSDNAGFGSQSAAMAARSAQTSRLLKLL